MQHDLWQFGVGAIASAAVGFATANSWLEKRVEKAVQRATAPYEEEVQELRARVEALELDRKVAKAALVDILTIAAHDNLDDILELSKNALSSLP